jgi:uncharacterized protein (DUF4415 family)
MEKKLNSLVQDLKQNEPNVTCTSATVTSSNKVSESANDKLASAKALEESKELSATAILKQNVSETLASWNKKHVCSALFANVSSNKIDTFISVTENCTKYPVKNYTGNDAIISTEIIDGKDFSFIAFPETLTAANVVTIFNAVCTYNKTLKDSIANEAENKAKAKQAQIKALQTVISITTDANVLSALKSQLEALQK